MDLDPKNLYITRDIRLVCTLDRQLLILIKVETLLVIRIEGIGPRSIELLSLRIKVLIDVEDVKLVKLLDSIVIQVFVVLFLYGYLYKDITN